MAKAVVVRRALEARVERLSERLRLRLYQTATRGATIFGGFARFFAFFERCQKEGDR
jgi:hypothetical protein